MTEVFEKESESKEISGNVKKKWTEILERSIKKGKEADKSLIKGK